MEAPVWRKRYSENDEVWLWFTHMHYNTNPLLNIYVPASDLLTFHPDDSNPCVQLAAKLHVIQCKEAA